MLLQRPSACKQCSRLYKRCSCKQWPCTYTAPCVARNLLGRIPNPHSCHALAAPQHAPGPRSDARSQRTPPRRSTGNRTPSTTRTPTIRPPGGIPDTRSTHPHSPDQTPSSPRWKLCGTRSPTRSGPQTARKPARLSSRTGFFFCMMEPDTPRRTLPNTQQAAPRPPANLAA